MKDLLKEARKQSQKNLVKITDRLKQYYEFQEKSSGKPRKRKPWKISIWCSEWIAEEFVGGILESEGAPVSSVLCSGGILKVIHKFGSSLWDFFFQENSLLKEHSEIVEEDSS